MFRFPVEAGHIQIFARAIDDNSPVHSDPDIARSCGFSNVIAPPTFVEAGAHFDPRSEVRPQPGQMWFGSAAAPTGDPAREARATGTTLHAETHFEYHRHLVAGDVLTVTERPGTTWERVGARGGRLRFRDWFVDHVDQHGHLAVTVRTVAVTTDEKLPPPTDDNSDPRGTTDLDLILRDDGRSGPVEPGEIDVGMTRSMLLIEDLTRTRIVQYAGASGDFSPQHTDEYYNTNAAGYPTVFAHGMLTMGMTARLLTGWFGHASLVRYGLRFLQPVWPGDTLVATGRITSAERLGASTSAEVAIETVNQRGAPVVRGSAVVHVPSM